MYSSNACSNVKNLRTMSSSSREDKALSLEIDTFEIDRLILVSKNSWYSSAVLFCREISMELREEQDTFILSFFAAIIKTFFF